MEILFLYLRQYEYFQQLNKQIREYGKIESMELNVLPFYSKEALEILPEYIVLLKIEIHAKNLGLLKISANIKRLVYRLFHLDKRRIYLFDIFNELAISKDNYDKISNVEGRKNSFPESIRESKTDQPRRMLYLPKMRRSSAMNSKGTFLKTSKKKSGWSS